MTQKNMEDGKMGHEPHNIHIGSGVQADSYPMCIKRPVY